LTSNPLELTQVEPLPDDLATALDRARPRLGRMGSPLYYYPSAGSTNDLASRLARSGATDGTTVVAAAQTAGRGRLGRTWFSPPGAGLYVSIVIRLGVLDRRLPGIEPAPAEAPIPLPSRLTLLTGVALAEAVRGVTGLQAEIKWPNDIVFQGRKLAGILAEASARDGAIEHIVIGVGINIQAVEYPPEIVERASSLEHELGRSVERGALLAEFLVNLGQARSAMHRDEDVADWLERWGRLSPSANGALVEWHAPDGVRRGRTAGLDRDGALLVEANRGTERVMAGEVIWLKA
jgi:BirA family biotin operon repressor/biotin-[acetyl-CoA-carboxylase] ligase